MLFNILGKLSQPFVAILFLGIITFSPPTAAETTDIVTAHPALWQVENGTGKVYLLGSFHLLPKNYRWYEGIIQTSLENSGELVVETDISTNGLGEIQAAVAKNAFFTDGDNLKNHLDAAHYQAMLISAKKLMGLTEDMAQRSKPWFMAIQLSMTAIMSSGMDPESGVDRYLQNIATKSGKIISGLETPTEQMMALIDHPLDVQTAMLVDTLDKMEDFKAYIDHYLEAWALGDADKINQTMVADMAEHEAMYQALLVNRNKNWMPTIENHIKSGKTVFIVVGAAHLVGADGIIKMLRDKDYQVDKIQ